MAFAQRTDWKDLEEGGTPVMAADLLRIESGVKVNETAAAAAALTAAIGSAAAGGVPGSILHIDSSGNLAQDSTNLFWDALNRRIGLGEPVPLARLHVQTVDENSTGQIIKGTVGQLVNLSEWYVDTGLTVNSAIDKDGNLDLMKSESPTTGVIFKAGSRFLHDFVDPTGDTATPVGENVFLGKDAGNFTMGATATSTDHGSYNTGIGVETLDSVTEGFMNTGVGYHALKAVTTGSYNVGLGFQANRWCSLGSQNIAIGYTASSYNKIGIFNVAIGGSALTGASSSSNVSNNTAIGFKALTAVLTGANNNVALGYKAGDNLTTGAKNILIGNDIDAQSATANGQLSLGNLVFGTGIDGIGTTVSSGKIGIGVVAPASKLTVAGDVEATGSANGIILASPDGTRWRVTVDNSGVLSTASI